MPRIVTFAELVAQPWKNGGGATRTVYSFPEGAGLDDFDWRISIADVVSDGPFSRFAGVDRTLAILDGPGMTLSVDGERTGVDRDTRTIRFAGEAEVVAALRDGPTRDFNVMTRRSRFTHRIEMLAHGRIEIDTMETLALIFIGDGARIAWPGGSTELARFDTILATVDDGAVSIEGYVFAVRLIPVSDQNAFRS